LSAVYGEGIQNYMNDAPVDIGIQNQFDNARSPVKGVALPVLGLVAFYDRYWSDKFSSSFGYSMIDIDNSDAQAASAFKKGSYAIGNIIYYPTANAMMAVEFQYGSRDNFKDGWNTEDYRVQVTFKYNFSQKFYAEKTPE
jgi:hypothetical protein